MTLKKSLSKKQAHLNTSTNNNNNVSVFGTSMSKGMYSLLVWSIIFILLLLLIFFIFKFKDSNKVTENAKLALTELESEYEEHRKTAVEREQKVRRQLLDEINKQKTITTKK